MNSGQSHRHPAGPGGSSTGGCRQQRGRLAVLCAPGPARVGTSRRPAIRAVSSSSKPTSVSAPARSAGHRWSPGAGPPGPRHRQRPAHHQAAQLASRFDQGPLARSDTAAKPSSAKTIGMACISTQPGPMRPHWQTVAPTARPPPTAPRATTGAGTRPRTPRGQTARTAPPSPARCQSPAPGAGSSAAAPPRAMPTGSARSATPKAQPPTSPARCGAEAAAEAARRR